MRGQIMAATDRVSVCPGSGTLIKLPFLVVADLGDRMGTTGPGLEVFECLGDGLEARPAPRNGAKRYPGRYPGLIEHSEIHGVSTFQPKDQLIDCRLIADLEPRGVGLELERRLPVGRVLRTASAVP